MAENFVSASMSLTAKFTRKSTVNSAVEENVAEFNDIIGITGSYALNTIPHAVLSVATGRAVQSPFPAATIHDAIKNLRPRDKVVVTLNVKYNDGDDKRLNKYTNAVIFEGYYVGSGYQRSAKSANFSLHLIHWLDDLNCASILNSNWQPNVPFDIAQAAHLAQEENPSAPGANAVQPALFAQIADPGSQIIRQIEEDNKDLWDDILKKLFIKLANELPGGYQFAGDADEQRATLYDKTRDELIVAALNRITGPRVNDTARPLTLDFPDSLKSNLVGKTGELISATIANGAAYSTFWSKLVGDFASNFFFAISPGPVSAQVIPFFGGLRTEFKTINGEDYSHANFNVNTHSVLEAVQIRHRQIFAAGTPTTDSVDSERPKATSPAGKYLLINKPAGEYPPRTDPASLRTMFGQISIRSAPTILSIGNPETVDDYKMFGDKICEQWYKSDVLSQRTAEIFGKLRFDIAPGSIVKILEPLDNLKDMGEAYGAVVSVEYTINAEQHTAGTAFKLVFLRSETENMMELLTADKPPIYKNAWEGSTLIKDS